MTATAANTKTCKMVNDETVLGCFDLRVFGGVSGAKRGFMSWCRSIAISRRRTARRSTRATQPASTRPWTLWRTPTSAASTCMSWSSRWWKSCKWKRKMVRPKVGLLAAVFGSELAQFGCKEWNAIGCRGDSLPWGVVGPDVPPLEQNREGLLHEKQNVRHQQDPGYLRLHQVRSAAQPAHHSVRAGRRAVHQRQVFGRYCYTAGKCYYFLCFSLCRQMFLDLVQYLGNLRGFSGF